MRAWAIRPDMSYIFSKSGRNRDPDNPVKRAIMCVPGPTPSKYAAVSDPTIPQLCGLLQVRALHMCTSTGARLGTPPPRRARRPQAPASIYSTVACAHADAAFASCPPWSRRVAFSSCPLSSFRPHAYGSCCREQRCFLERPELYVRKIRYPFKETWIFVIMRFRHVFFENYAVPYLTS